MKINPQQLQTAHKSARAPRAALAVAAVQAAAIHADRPLGQAESLAAKR